MSRRFDEFAWIDALRPLAAHPAALRLSDDVAVLPRRAGFDLVVSTDAMAEGRHFPAGEAGGIIGRRLLRAALSDLAAKAAEPFAWMLTAALPAGRRAPDAAWRAAFIAGLAEDQRRFGVALIGGDTITTSGPMVLDATVFGWAPEGKAILRSGARAGDALIVCGRIGDAMLGLAAIRGEIADPDSALARAFRLPEPLFSLREPLLAHAAACADVSDGLMADAGRIAEASGLAVEIDLARLALSPAARRWLSARDDPERALVALAAGGDDYALACAVRPNAVDGFIASASAAAPAAVAGLFRDGNGVSITIGTRPVKVSRLGWRHG